MAGRKEGRPANGKFMSKPGQQFLSQRLQSLISRLGQDHPRSLNHLIEQTDQRGIYVVIILLCLPFSTPLPLPGLSNVLGLVIFTLAARLAFNLPPRLPSFVGNRELTVERMRAVLTTTVKVVAFFERIVKPRYGAWLDWAAVRWFNCAVLGFMAILLALPLPPIIPLSNTLPAYSIIVICLSMMEKDGIAIWLGYVCCTLTTVWIFSFTGIAISFIVRYWREASEWMHLAP